MHRETNEMKILENYIVSSFDRVIHCRSNDELDAECEILMEKISKNFVIIYLGDKTESL